MEVSVSFNFIPYDGSGHFFRIEFDPNKAGASYNSGDGGDNIILVMTTKFGDNSKKSYTYYEGTAAHEFGHTLGLPDAYPGLDIDQSQNKGFSCASNDIDDEIYISDSAYLSNPDAGEIMWVNGSAVSNDIEMLLWKYETGKTQCFLSSFNEVASPAIITLKWDMIFVQLMRCLDHGKEVCKCTYYFHNNGYTN